MRTLYITKYGSVLRVSGERFIVTACGKKEIELPAFKVTQIVIWGGGTVTPNALKYALAHNISIFFISSHGRYMGRIQPLIDHGLELRRAQFKAAENPQFCLGLSKLLITSKIRNGLHLLRKKNLGHTRSRSYADLFHSLKSIKKAKTVSQLRGIEGSASSKYFALFAKSLKYRFGFEKRIKRPPPDPINLLLSLGYTLLFNTVASLLAIRGFELSQGFLHTPRRGHLALASDMMEPMRSPVIDTLVLRVINLRILQEHHFEVNERNIRLRRDGLKRYLKEYERRLQSMRLNSSLAKSGNFKDIIERQTDNFAQMLLKKGFEFKPFDYMD